MNQQYSKIKTFLPKSFFGRSLMIMLVPTLLLLLISVWIFYDRHWDTITRRLSYSVVNDINIILRLVRDNYYTQDDIITIAQDDLALTLTFKKDGILPNLSHHRQGLLDEILARDLQQNIDFPFRIDTSAFKDLVIVYIQLPNHVLQINVPGKRLFSSTTYIFLLWVFGSSLLLYSIAVIFMRNQVKAIRRLSKSVTDFGKGRDTPVAFVANSAIEIQDATNAFNNMRNQINRFIKQRTDMLSGVSHDLRTPMTRIKLQLALMPKDKDTQMIADNLQEMESMIEGYLTFARGEGTEKAIEIKLDEFMHHIIDKWHYEKTPISYNIDHDDMVILLRPVAFTRCIDNLISNSIKYAQNIWINIHKKQHEIHIIIDDDGIGIREELREKMLRPFQKDNNDTSLGGTGLGLAVSHDVVQLHGGELSLETSPHDDGLRVHIRLPL